MWEDEGRFGRINDPRRCWAPERMRPKTGCQIVREYIYAFAAICPYDGTLDSLILPDANAGSMSIFLAEVSSRHPGDRILMFMDGAGWHKAKGLVVPLNIIIKPIPPYSPEVNPVEHLWDEMREKWFANKVFDSLDAVEDQMVVALRTLESEPERVGSLAGFDWIVSIC